MYAHWDYIDIVVNQKFNITEYFKEFDNSLNIKKYKIEKIDMDLSSGKTSKAKAKISKKGVLTVSKEGLIRVTPLVKDGKKYVPVEGIEPYVLNVVKPGVLKKIKTVPESEITVNDLITNFPANSNTVKLSIPKKTKVATYDEQNNSVKLIKKGKVKITVTITNIQGNSVKYSCTVNCKLKP